MDSNNINSYTSPDRSNPFASACLSMGVLAIFTIFTVFLPLFFGALSILFGCLARRRKKLMATPAFIGTVISVISMSFATILLCISLMELPGILKDPVQREQFNTSCKTMTGVTFDELMEESGVDLDAIFNK